MIAEFGRVASEDLPHVWEEVAQILAEKDGGYLQIVSEAELFQAICLEHYELWIGRIGEDIELAVICAWERHSNASYYHICWVGGAKLLQFFDKGLEKLEHYACLFGASNVKFGGRPGWARLMEKKGYVSEMLMSKPVNVCWRN